MAFNIYYMDNCESARNDGCQYILKKISFVEDNTSMSFSKEDLPFSCTEKNENKYEGSQECSPEIDIVINNVVCTFNLRCHINLRRLAMNGLNVEFKRGNGVCFSVLF